MLFTSIVENILPLKIAEDSLRVGLALLELRMKLRTLSNIYL